MIHVVMAILLIVLAVPLLAWYYQLSECKDLIALSTEPSIYKRMHNGSFTAKINDTGEQYQHVWFMIIVFIANLLPFGLLWYGLAGNLFESDSTFYLASAYNAAMIVWFWQERLMPIWMFNWKIDLLKTRDKLNLEIIAARLVELDASIQLIGDPQTPGEQAKLNSIVTEIEYLLHTADVVQQKLDDLPKPIEQ